MTFNQLNSASIESLSYLEPTILTVLSSELVGLPATAVEVLLRRWNFPEDEHDARPRSDRWTVGEIDDLILMPVRTLPQERHVVVVHQADAMASSAAEHLLKIVEEPATPTSFIFCVSDAEKLLPTIRGRANHVVHLRALDPLEISMQLESQGIDPQRARMMVARAGAEAALVPLLVDDELFAAAADLDTPAVIVKPVTTAVDTLASIEKLAHAVTHPDGGKPDALTRAATRQLLREVLRRRRAATHEQLRAGDSASRADKELRALTQAEHQLMLGASPLLVLASVLTRTVID